VYQLPVEESQRGTPGQYHEGNGRPIHTAETEFFPRLSANGYHGDMSDLSAADTI